MKGRKRKRDKAKQKDGAHMSLNYYNGAIHSDTQNSKMHRNTVSHE